jgi:hypothetical protein
MLYTFSLMMFHAGSLYLGIEASRGRQNFQRDLLKVINAKHPDLDCHIFMERHPVLNSYHVNTLEHTTVTVERIDKITP